MESRKGFTLIELMVVILIVGILAAVAIPMMRGRIDSAKWSEGKSVMGTIATAIRVHVAEKGANYTSVATLSELGFSSSDLTGTYFTGGESGVGSFAWAITDDDPIAFTVTGTAPAEITTPYQIVLAQDGSWTETASAP